MKIGIYLFYTYNNKRSKNKKKLKNFRLKKFRLKIIKNKKLEFVSKIILIENL